ncbi:MAG: citrate synthase [Candidatus Kapaibacterium sp.]
MNRGIVQNGLRGVVAAETALSEVDGEAGQLVIRGFPLEEIAPNAEFEEMIFLLATGELPTAEERESIKRQLATHRELPDVTLFLLRDAAAAGIPAMDALRMAVGTLRLAESGESDLSEALPIIAQFPVIVATYYRLMQGKEPLPPRSDLGHVANYLYMMRGEVPGREEVRALETYLNTVVDHGLNASTFTARVITSTGSDLVSAITGAVGALKGPLHGGAPGPALDMVFEIGEIGRAEEYLRAKIERGERLMGFGHRVYKVRDPRADVLAEAAKRLFAEEGDATLYELATGVEKIALALLEEYKPGRNLQTNVEFYTALLLHGAGLPTDLFTPTFAVSRMVGWIAHCFEQRELGTIIRPESVYSGPRDRMWSK